jgi:hypothetical protein
MGRVFLDAPAKETMRYAMRPCDILLGLLSSHGLSCIRATCPRLAVPDCAALNHEAKTIPTGTAVQRAVSGLRDGRCARSRCARWSASRRR